MSTIHHLSRFAAVAVGFALAGCGGNDTIDPASGDGVVTTRASSVNLSVQPIMDEDGNLLTPTGLKGTYGKHCKVNAGKTWNLKLNDPSDDGLKVALNDTFQSCPLTVTAVTSKLGKLTVESPLIPPIVLGTAYAPEPSKVNLDHTPLLMFYTNAKLEGLEGSRYTNDFSINLLYSDHAEVCRAEAPPAVYAKVAATAGSEQVTPPDYSMRFKDLKLEVDADQLVQDSSTGNVTLQAQTQPGEEWKIFGETAWCCEAYTFAAIDAFYKSGDVVASGAIEGSGDVQIPWTSFDLLGRKLPKARTLIVKHTGEGGVYSYELFQVMFPGPRSWH